jgi:hypothetical protein
MIVLALGAGTVFCREWSRSWLVEGMSDLKRKENNYVTSEVG